MRATRKRTATRPAPTVSSRAAAYGEARTKNKAARQTLETANAITARIRFRCNTAVTAVMIVDRLSTRIIIKSASGIGGHAPLPESGCREAGEYCASNEGKGNNTGIEKRDAPFDTGLSELEGSVIMVFWVSLRPFNIQIRNAGLLPFSGYPATLLTVFLLF
jgi:hypothetical protein